MNKKNRQELLMDGLVAIPWAIYAGGYFLKAWQGPGSLHDLGLLVYYSLAALLFILRRSNKAHCQWWETAIAMAAIFWPILILRPSGHGASIAGFALQMIGLAGIIVAISSLGRSFAIAPGDRGLVTGGLYRWVRHPLYATQTVFFIGYLIANPSLRNGLGLAGALAFDIVRIHREERILSGYTAYAADVRWRLLPLIW